MPMKVHPSHTGEVTAARFGNAAKTLAATKASASSASFAGMLATQTGQTTSGTVPATDVASSTTTTASAVKLRKGESMSAVHGHPYAEISGGKRDGLYVNTSNNKRRGQAFVLVHRNGREYHIYGTGKDRVVVALRKHADTDTPKATTAPNTAASTGGVTPTVSAS
jgi:hypothetical protein